MWEQPKMVKVCSEQSGMSIRQVHEMLPKNVVEDDGKTAFRSLFPNELLETGIPQASPQFKMI